MSAGWLDVDDGAGHRRYALTEGLTRIGGAGAELSIAEAGSDQVHVWNDPPRAIFVGGGTPPRLNGTPLTEQPLAPGDRLEWHGKSYVYGGQPAAALEASLEELAPEPAPAYAPPPAGRVLSPEEEQLFDRMIAGMLVELNLADKAAAKRWQSSVIDGVFQPDDCAKEILARSGVAASDNRLDQRSSRLLRDMLMAPLLRGTKGATRKMRKAAKGGVAYVIMNVVVMCIYILMVFIGLVVWRLQGGDVNGVLDFVLRR